MIFGNQLGQLCSWVKSILPIRWQRLITTLQLRQAHARLPITDIAFQLVPAISPLEFTDDLQLTLSPMPRQASIWELFVTLRQSDDELVAYCEYNQDILEAGRVTKWLAEYEALLEKSSLPLLKHWRY